MSNIHGLGPVKKGDDKKGGEKKDEEFNVGGAKSNTAVLRPVKGADLMDSLIKSARANAEGGKEAMRTGVLITIYKNGFQVAGGEFRDLKVPENVKYLEALNDGEVPEELEREIRKNLGQEKASHVQIQLVNKQDENYVPKFDFKQTQGTALGADVSSTVKSVVAQECKVDDTQPTTNIQIVLHPRQRVKVAFNQSHTVMHLFQHIAFLSKVTKFDVLANFPPQPLTNMNATLKEAGLLNASVQQRLP